MSVCKDSSLLIRHFAFICRRDKLKPIHDEPVCKLLQRILNYRGQQLAANGSDIVFFNPEPAVDIGPIFTAFQLKQDTRQKAFPPQRSQNYQVTKIAKNGINLIGSSKYHLESILMPCPGSSKGLHPFCPWR